MEILICLLFFYFSIYFIIYFILFLHLQLNVSFSKEKLNGTKFHLTGWNLDILQEWNVCSYH